MTRPDNDAIRVQYLILDSTRPARPATARFADFTPVGSSFQDQRVPYVTISLRNETGRTVICLRSNALLSKLEYLKIMNYERSLGQIQPGPVRPVHLILQNSSVRR